ncbi:hypothetical protein KTO58_24550 [Chitinophaga pendula]|uniref:hypothetical protein n=1 Tax=Chitinophaga TaxID=79328 RepID=UPI000BAF9D28|nr:MULTISPECIES: hypothetical protein [Chitinophaga]ASZ10240.1 hypothetical protein CK934_04215 [Chitinophaga sp. MD30]UCJ06801.1 hypothetical protein KTO58_24550 [Chitinophaga pendula]
MLSLSDTNWQHLHHAYGATDDVPGLINQLIAGQHEEADDLFYGMLCHQYTIYDATLAAVPHLYSLLEKEEEHGRILDLCGFFACVYAFDYGDHTDGYDALRKNKKIDPALLQTIGDAYRNTASQLQQYCLTLLDRDNQLTAEDKKQLLVTIAAVSGSKAIARALIIYNEDEYVCLCPHCQGEVFIWNESNRLQAYGEDPVFHKEQEKHPVAPQPIDLDNWNGAYNRIDAPFWMADFAIRYDIEDYETIVAQLFGQAACPHCKQPFELMPALEAGT